MPTAKPPSRNTRKTAISATITRPEILRGGSDLKFRQFVHDLFVFAARSQEIRGKLAGHIGLTGLGYSILMVIIHLRRTGSSVGINDIAAGLHLSGSLITNEVNKLLAAGLVTKTPHPDDRRRVILALTDEARDRINKALRILRPVNDVWFESLSSEDFDHLTAIIGNLASASDRALKLIDFLLETSVVKELDFAG
jgi:DNA-binding MarR family transcriptional regulator